ncbi:PDZ domain-containing protein [Streptomyces sp. NPDC094153]|uniref:S41 family peptidase n=1 Tax=Streptomyces sp. NPDC094153 TaxID=3366058 RepID=UPI0038096059
MSTQPYLRHPHLLGDLIVSVADDDVWGTTTAGGRAWRLTADRVRVATPRISPDGRLLAWTSSRDGVPEAYVMPVEGGEPRRLTHFGHGSTRVAGWTPSGEVVVLTAQHTHSAHHTWAWAVPPADGPARRLPFGPVGDVAFGPNGAVLLKSVTMLREAAYWKGYRGGTTDGGEFTPVPLRLPGGGRPGNVECPLWVADEEDGTWRIAYLGDGDGRGRLWSSTPDGRDPRCHTPGLPFYARGAATDGRRVVLHSGGDLWLLPGCSPDAEAHRIDLRLTGVRAGTLPYRVAAEEWTGDYDLDASGAHCVVEIRGTVHHLAPDGSARRALSERPGVRCRLPRFAGPGGEVVWVSDAFGEDRLERCRPGQDPRPLAVGALGRVLELRISADGRYAALASHDGRVLLVDLDREKATEVDQSRHEEVTGLAFSPDGRWLAWSHPGPERMRQIRLADTAAGTVWEATEMRFCDHAPVFTRDGRHLAFLSDRVFDPEYQAHSLDLAVVAAGRPHLLALTDDCPDRPAGKATATAVELRGLPARVVPLPVEAGVLTDLAAADDCLLWIRRARRGELGDARAGVPGPAPADVLEHWDLRHGRLSVLRQGIGGYRVSPDGTRLLLHDGTALVSRAPADGSAERPVDLSSLRVVVHPQSEWRQAYDEDARIMRDNFWRPDLGGVHWTDVQERYRPLLDRLGSREEFVDLLWEVHGELRCSHAYVTVPYQRSGAAPADAAAATGRPGLLGADLTPDAEGVWRVTRVLPGDSSVPAARSPLATPGVAVRPGDALLAVDGKPVDPVTGPAPLLLGTANRPVELTVRPAAGGPTRAVTVVPLAAETALRYQDLVTGRRAHVRRRGGGRLGYLHVPDMSANGWAQLHRDLRAEMGHDAVVVDFRENAGGHLSHLVVERLARRVLGWHLRRGSRPETYPVSARRGPLVFLADQLTGSDGDCAVAAVQELGLGPVVGTRTWGGVLGMETGYALVDGTGLVQPRGGYWLERGGWGVENHGVEPDIEVVLAPQDAAAGTDPQLDTAIRVALDALDRQAPAVPPSPPAGLAQVRDAGLPGLR